MSEDGNTKHELEFLTKLAKHGFEYFVGGISAMIFFYGILGPSSREVNEEELLALLLLGGLGVLLSIFIFTLKRVTWFKAKIEEIKLLELQDTNYTLREEINSRKKIDTSGGEKSPN